MENRKIVGRTGGGILAVARSAAANKVPIGLANCSLRPPQPSNLQVSFIPYHHKPYTAKSPSGPLYIKRSTKRGPVRGLVESPGRTTAGHSLQVLFIPRNGPTARVHQDQKVEKCEG